MKPFAKRLMWPAFAILGILFVAVGCTVRTDRALVETEAGPYEGTTIEGAASDFALTDHEGERVALSDFDGQVVVLTFLDSQCVDVCPLTASHLRLAHGALGDEAQSVVFLGVNVNREASDIADVAAATARWQLNEIPTWHFLTGDADELEPVWKAYNVGVFPAEDDEAVQQVLHTSGVFVIDQEGQKRWYISTPYDETGTPQWTAPLSELLVKQIRAVLEEG